LAELLRLNHLNPVYHGGHSLRSLKELVRSYITITKDLGRVRSRSSKWAEKQGFYYAKLPKTKIKNYCPK
jgi:hypothetical protein